jgi:hypothetical protein
VDKKITTPPTLQKIFLTKQQTKKKTKKNPRLRAGWDTDYLEQLLDVLQAA